MADQDGLEQALVGIRRQDVAAFVERSVGEARPVADDAAAGDGAARHEGEAAGAVVGAAAAVLGRRAPELGDDHDDRLPPGFAQAALQLQEAAGEVSQQLRQPTLLGEMGVPAL